MPEQASRVLVVDDNTEVLEALQMLLEARGFEVQVAKSPTALPALLEEEPIEAVLLDMNFREDASSGREGFRWLDNILQIDPSVAVIMITAYGDVEKAVRAMREGAEDFIVKPWDDDRLVDTLRTALTVKRSREEADRMKAEESPNGGETSEESPPEEEAPDDALEAMVGESAAMQAVFRKIEKVAATDVNVFLLGENGTGKELAARALHQHSERAGSSFVTADLGALNESLFESELFGHAKGAFTGAEEDRPGRFEVASGGTLFLDEIGNIPPPLQKKLLTALQHREVTRVGETEARPVDIRLLSATNRPIYERVKEGSFRQDLLYRINTVEIHLPPLRERPEDIPLLADHFFEQYAQKYQTPAQKIGAPAKKKLRGYHWPGNVRELKHTVERATVLSEREALQPADFRFSAPVNARADGEEGEETLNLEEIEQATVRKALSKHGGNISRAAEELGIARKTLYSRIEKYGL
jgi:DNA-binding NtrC family response regulator